VLKKSTKLRSYGSVTNSSFCHTWVNLFLSGAFAIQGVQRAIDENWDAALVQIDPSARCTSDMDVNKKIEAGCIRCCAFIAFHICIQLTA